MADEIKRMRYFNGLFLKENDFTLDQDYHIRMRRLHNRHLHTWGIAWGLEVEHGHGPTQITVKEGMAINKVLKDGEAIGQEIILPLDQEVDLSEYNPGDGVYIYISYSEEEADIVPEKGGDTKKIHWLENAVISHSTTKPVNENEDIILAKVVIKGDGTIDAASIEYEEGGNSIRTYSGFAGKSLQAERLTLSIEGVTSNLAYIEGKKFGSDNGIQVTSPQTDFSGSLTINGNLGIGTSPSERLHINGSVRGDQSGALRINTGNGYIDIGPQNTNWSHFRTDRQRYFFDKEIRVQSGLIGSYNENLQLCTSGTTRLTIRNDNGNVGIGTGSPETPLHILGGSWNISVSEGDLKIGDGTYRLKIGVARAGAGAGDVRIRAYGGTNRLMLGSGTKDVLTIKDGLDVNGNMIHRGFTLRHEGADFTMAYAPRGNGGRALVHTGDGTNETLILNYNGDFNKGTRIQGSTLQIDGDTQIGDSSNINGRLTIFGPLNTSSQDGALIIRYGGSTYLRVDHNEIDCTGGLYLNYWSKKYVQVGQNTTGAGGMAVYGNLQVYGNISASGSKSGYVTDNFVNQSGDELEEGDVVVLGEKSIKVYYGNNDNIPVPEVDLTTTSYNRCVCGIVSEILVEEEPNMPIGAEGNEIKEKGKTKKRVKGDIDDGVKRLQVFSSKEIDKLDPKRIGNGQIGKMVTLGAFAHCKVDADIAAIKVGDLLTTSPTKGHAQKVLDTEKAVGAIIGKSLASLKKGKGKIPILVMMQ